MNNQVLAGRSVIKSNRRDAHPDSPACSRRNFQIEIRDVDVVNGAMLNAETSHANRRAESSGTPQSLVTGFAQYFFGCITKQLSRASIPPANFTVLGDNERAVVSVFE